MPDLSTKPYLIRAIHEWCTDSGHTPYLAVAVDERTIVPRAYVKGGEIVLNVSHSATNGLRIGNDLIEFQARFGGVAHDLSIPVDNVSAIYARENGHGMAFEVPKAPAVPAEPSPQEAPARRGPRLATSDGASMADGEQRSEVALVGAGNTNEASEAPAEPRGKRLNVVDAAPSRRRGRGRDTNAPAASPASVPVVGDAPAAELPTAPVEGTTPTGAGEPVPVVPVASPDGEQARGPTPGTTAGAPAKVPEGGDGPKDGAPSSRRSGRPRLTRIK